MKVDALDLARKYYQDVLDAEFEHEFATGKDFLVVTRGVKIRVELNKDNTPKKGRKSK